MEKIEVSTGKYIPNKKSPKKNNVLIIFILLVIFFFLGMGIMYLYSMNNPTVVTKNRTISETKVTEEAMEDAISKVYDSVLCIEVLNNNGDTISSGTGFVYGKDDKY